MREILFRGKRLDNGEWVKGNLFVPDSPDRPTEICIGTNIVRITYEVDPSTVGQYTGLKDKNGKKIFEGDILEFEAYGTHFKGHVEIVNGNASIMCKNASPFLDLAVEKHGAEVIGNIHDNPELIGGKL